MKIYAAILLPLITCGALHSRADDSSVPFHGYVVDGCDNPIAGAFVRFYNGHMGLSDYVIDFETNVVTDSDGRYSGTIEGDPSTTYRILRNEGYPTQTTCGGWRVGETNRLLESKVVSQADIEHLKTLDGEHLLSAMVSILGTQWELKCDDFVVLAAGPHLRPALKKATRHKSEHVRFGANRFLRLAGFPEDIPPYKPWTYTGTFHQAIGSADRLVIRQGGYDCCGSVDAQPILLAVTNRDAIANLRTNIVFRTQQSWNGCLCCGYPGIDWYTGTNRIVLTSLQHVSTIRWKGFLHHSDAVLTKESALWLAEWMRQHGIPDQHDEFRKTIEKSQQSVAPKTSEPAAFQATASEAGER